MGMLRAFGLLTLALAVVACGDSTTEATDIDVSGKTYALTSFAGASVPLTQIQGAECQVGTGADEEVALQAASLSFTSTAFSMDWTIQRRCLDAAGDPVGDWVDVSFTATGSYVLDVDELTLDDPAGYGTWTGTAGAGTLSLTAANVTPTVWTLQN